MGKRTNFGMSTVDLKGRLGGLNGPADGLDVYTNVVDKMQSEVVLNEINKRLASAEQSNQRLKAQLAAKDEDNRNLQKNIEEARSEIAIRDERLLDAEGRELQLKDQVCSLHHNLINTQQEVAQLTERSARAEDKCEKLQRANIDKETAGWRTQEEIQRLDGELKASKMEEQRLQEQVKGYSADVENLRLALAATEAERVAQEQREERGKAYIEELQAIMERLDSEKEALRSKLLKAEESNHRLQVIRENQAEQRAELERKLSGLGFRTDAQEKVLSKQKARVNELLVRDGVGQMAERIPHQVKNGLHLPKLGGDKNSETSSQFSADTESQAGSVAPSQLGRGRPSFSRLPSGAGVVKTVALPEPFRPKPPPKNQVFA